MSLGTCVLWLHHQGNITLLRMTPQKNHQKKCSPVCPQ